MSLGKLSILIVFSLCFLGCAAPKALEFRRVESVRVQQLSTVGDSKLLIGLRLYNPNSYGLQLKNGNIGIYLNDKFVGQSGVDIKTLVPGSNEFTLPLSVSINIKSIIGNALQLLINPKVRIGLKGSIQAGKGGVFVRVPIDWVTEQNIVIQ